VGLFSCIVELTRKQHFCSAACHFLSTPY